MQLAIGTGSCADNGQNLAIGDTKKLPQQHVLPIQGRHRPFRQRFKQARTTALKVDDLPFYGKEALALRVGCLGARHRPLDHQHAVGKRTNVIETEAGGDHPLDLAHLRHGQRAETHGNCYRRVPTSAIHARRSGESSARWRRSGVTARLWSAGSAYWFWSCAENSKKSLDPHIGVRLETGSFPPSRSTVHHVEHSHLSLSGRPGHRICPVLSGHCGIEQLHCRRAGRRADCRTRIRQPAGARRWSLSTACWAAA